MTDNPNKRILNERYRAFLDRGEIQTLTEQEIQGVLSNISGEWRRAARCLVCTLYYTGCRPSEALELTAKDHEVQGVYLVIRIPGKKKGLTRPVYLNLSLPLVGEIKDYALVHHPDYYIYHAFKGAYVRYWTNKKGERKTRVETSDKFRYHFRKWSDGVLTPYFMRHSRFSKLAEAGATPEEIRQIKGARTLSSVTPYLHLTSTTGKKMARKIR